MKYKIIGDQELIEARKRGDIPIVPFPNFMEKRRIKKKEDDDNEFNNTEG